MKEILRDDLEYATVEGHRMHIFRTGDRNRLKLVFMSGSGTVAPMYDFKILYQKLVADFRIIVIEKFGYGYSDLYDAPSDIDSLVSYQKQALDDLGEKGPFILLPHSMSGLEAIRWKQKYPDDIQAIIGLDMALPVQYINWGKDGLDRRIKQMKKLRSLHDKGLLFWYPLNKRGLDTKEIRQQRLLWKRNAFNDCMISGAGTVLDNAHKVDESGDIQCPMLMFVSDGKQVSENWINYQYQFAEKMKTKIVQLNCGHYIHYFESEYISNEIREFVIGPYFGTAYYSVVK